MANTDETHASSNENEHCMEHVVHLKAIGLTGIVLDSTKTKETVSKVKDMLVPPRQMKASLVVIRDDKVCGMSSLSKGLIQSNTAPSSIVSNGKPTRKQRRYLAIWNNNKASSENSSILFEAELSMNSSCTLPKNFDLFIGLTAYVDSVTTTIPIGVASLPLSEAVALQGPCGKVVLDLPVYNISPLQAASTNAFKKTNIENGSSVEEKPKNKRGLFASFRKRQVMRETMAVENDIPSALCSKRPCVYTLDTSQEDPSILRVELELHRKEFNVEIGLSSLSSSDPVLVDELKDESSHSVVNDLYDTLDSDSFGNLVKCINDMDRRSPSMDRLMEDQSFERVLSIRTNCKHTIQGKSRFLLNPTRRFRVKCIDPTSSKFELTPVTEKYDCDTPVQASSSFSELLKDLSSHDEAVYGNSDLVDVPIERVLSEPPIVDDDALMAALAQFTDEDSSLQENNIPFDEQSFLSRDTVAVKSQKKMKSSKTVSGNLNRKSEEVIKTLKIPLLWRRGRMVKTTDATNLPSVAGTESSNHSSSGSESNPESPVESDQLISVSSNCELVCETLTKQNSVKFPVSILRTPSTLKHKTKESVSPLSVTSTEHFVDEDLFPISPVQQKDSFSVVSSSADTAIFTKGGPISKRLIENEEREGIAAEKLESGPSLATNPTQQASPYSTSLPHFVEETTKPIILREKYEFDDDGEFLKRKMANAKLFSHHEGACHPDGTLARHEKPIVPKNLAQNFYQFIDLQPCAGKIEPLLAIDDEDFTIAESWTHNENSTLGTYDPPKETMHDDIADLGLLFDDMCRQSGFRTVQDDFSTRDTVTASLLDRNGGRQRWIAALASNSRSPFDFQSSKNFKRNSVSRPHMVNADDYSDIEEQSLSVPSSDHSSDISGDEQTLRSSGEESTSMLSEQGTEVNVNDVNLIPREPTTISEEINNKMKSDTRKYASAPLPAIKMTPIGIKKERSSIIARLPPKDPNRKFSPPQMPLSVKKKPKLPLPALGDESNGSRNDSLTPSRKSIAQSFVDFVEYVITPSPYNSPNSSVPTLLMGDDAASVGELTATTYERQIEVDEMRRQSAQHYFLPVNVVHTLNKSSLADYNGRLGPEVAAAMEAAAVKKLAESLVNSSQ